jgi:uncharacterized protein (DUF433 family)
MKAVRELMVPLRIRRGLHRADLAPHRTPEAWLEARERSGALPIDDAQTIGEVFDRAIARVSHAISRARSRLRGVPCLRGTRIPAYQICGMAAEGIPLKRVAKILGISETQVKAAVKFASIVLEQ